MSTIVTPEDSAALASLYRKLNWRLLPLLFVCYVFAYLDRINVGFAKLQMQNDLGLSDAAYGVGAGVFFLGYVLFELPSNLMLPRVGARKTFSRILVLWGITSACMLFVRDVPTFYAMRFLLGVFEAGFAPGMIYYLSCWYGPKRMAGHCDRVHRRPHGRRYWRSAFGVADFHVRGRGWPFGVAMDVPDRRLSLRLARCVCLFLPL